MNKNILTVLFKNSDLLKKNKVKFNQLNNIIQSGGDNELIINYHNHKYIFEESQLEKNHYILSSKNNDECVYVIISDDKTAEIHGIGNYNSCIYDSNQNIGSKLLKLTLKMLKKYKNKFNIDLVILTDNSIKRCGQDNIKLPLMLTLLTGDTWYGKYGFRPISIRDNKYILDKVNNEYYEKNKKIMNTIKISDFNLLKYIQKTENTKLIKATENLINSYPNMLLKDFLRNFLNDYDKNCQLFNLFYEKLYSKIKLFSLYKQSFGLFL